MRQNEPWSEEIYSEIDHELKNIAKLEEELKEVLGKNSSLSRRIKGSILHDFYNCCERIFRRIAVDINGGFDTEERWHKELLYRMTIPIGNIRPHVLSEELAAELDDYLSFRHVFRNIYGFELKGARLDRLVEKFEQTSRMFKTEVGEFLKRMQDEDSEHQR